MTSVDRIIAAIEVWQLQHRLAHPQIAPPLMSVSLNYGFRYSWVS